MKVPQCAARSLAARSHRHSPIPAKEQDSNKLSPRARSDPTGSGALRRLTLYWGSAFREWMPVREFQFQSRSVGRNPKVT